MKFTITTTLDVPVGNLIKRRLLHVEWIESTLRDDVRDSLKRADFLVGHSITGRVKVGRVTVRKQL